MPEKAKSRDSPVAVVTGASAGVGRATARALAEDGYDIALLARGRAGLRGAADEVRQAGRRALPIEIDIADAEAVFAAAEQVRDELGPIDLWVNNAMLTVFSKVVDTTPEDYRRVTDVTYLGTVYGTLAALSQMREQGHGHIIQIGSALAYRGIPLQSAYCAGKHAVQGFCDSLRAELLHEKSPVRLTMIQLPAINTPQFDWTKSRLPKKGQPVPPIFQPEVPARAVVWCSKRNKRELLLGFSSAIVVWGNKMLPNVGDHYLARNGVQSQQTDQDEDPNRPHNLWDPVDADQDHGAHGRFGERAKTSSMLFQIERHHLLWLVILIAVLVVIAVGVGMGVLIQELW